MDWKNSKLFIAASTFAGTTAFIILVFTSIVIPTINNKHETLHERHRNEIELTESYKDEVQAYKTKFTEAEKRIQRLELEITNLLGDNPFKPMNVIPFGFREYFIGSDITDIKTNDKILKINWAKDCVVLDVKHKLFFKLRLGYDLKDDRKVVRSIVFILENPGEDGAKYIFDLLKSEFAPLSYGKIEDSDSDFLFENLKGHQVLITAISYEIYPLNFHKIMDKRTGK